MSLKLPIYTLLFARIGSAAWAVDLPMPNADFETKDSGWSFNGTMSAISSTAAKTGAFGLEINDADTTQGSNVRSWKQVVEPLQSYQVDFDARVVNGTGIAVYLQFFDSNDQLIREDKEPKQHLRTIPDDTTNWKRFSLAATAPESAASLRIWIHSFSSNTVKTYFDNFSLQSVSEEAVQQHASDQSNTGQSKGLSWIGDPDNLSPFEKTSPATAFADLKILQANGSSFRIPREDWDYARTAVATDPEWTNWLADKKSEVDAWIQKNRDRAGWEAGWNHEFVSPVDGSFLVWTQDIPGEEVDHFTSKTGDRVEITDKLFRAWVGAFRKRHADMMIQAAYLYHLTEDKQYADWVAAQLDFYADNYDSWGNGVGQKQHSHLGYQSLDDAVIISRQIDAARLIFDYADSKRRSNWFTKLFKPEAELLDSCFQTIHNIATWQRATQAKIALLYDDDTLWEQAVHSTFGLKAQFLRGVTSDYIWYEQSMGYNGFIIMATHSLFNFSALVGKADMLREEAEIAENLLLAPLALRFPNSHLPNPSDNTGVPKASTTWLARTYRIFPTYLGIEAAKETRNWDTLIDPPNRVTQSDTVVEAELPDVVSRSLESSRFALLKKGPWQVFFHYGQLNRSHSQAEALNWSASYEGIMLTEDYGTVGYGSPLASGYFRKGLAHNVPLINGNGQQSWNQGELLQFDSMEASVSALQSKYRDQVSAVRSLKIENQDLVDTVTIRLDPEAQPAPLGLSLHIEAQAQLDTGFTLLADSDFQDERPGEFQYWSNIRSARFTDSASIPVQLGNKTWIEIEFTHEGPFTLYVAEAPGQPQTTHTGFYLETDPTTEATFTTRFHPQANTAAQPEQK